MQQELDMDYQTWTRLRLHSSSAAFYDQIIDNPAAFMTGSEQAEDKTIKKQDKES